MKHKPNTVGKLIELLKQYPPETMICVEDMDGNAMYFDDSIADHTDCDNPTVEILIPIYLKEISIECGSEDSVYLNQDVRVVGE